MLKAKIDNSGYLKVERKGEFKDQRCPYNGSDGDHCGDWCPHFGEVEDNFSCDTALTGDGDIKIIRKETGGKSLTICHGKTFEVVT